MRCRARRARPVARRRAARGPALVARVEGRTAPSAGASHALTGTVVEHYAVGQLQSRSVVSNGVLHGLSEGWHTNGVCQVAERFISGVSEGVRVKWYPDGAKLSEAAISGGKLNGTFRRWHESGRLAEQIDLRDDQPHGESVAYYPSGFLKTRLRMERGQPVTTETFKDGEVPGPPSLTAAAK